jgi:hypothetical protein
LFWEISDEPKVITKYAKDILDCLDFKKYKKQSVIGSETNITNRSTVARICEELKDAKKIEGNSIFGWRLMQVGVEKYI